MSKAISDAAAAMGRKGGRSTSAKKTAAVRRNLAKARAVKARLTRNNRLV